MANKNLWRRRSCWLCLAAVLGSRAASRAFGPPLGHSRPGAVAPVSALSALTRSSLARPTAAPRTTRTARPSLVTGPQLLFPVFASALGFLGVEAARQANDGAALKDLIQKYTNIIVKDAPDGAPNMPVDGNGVYWYVKDPDVYRRVLVQGDLGLGESYMDGLWESNDVEAFIREMIKLEPVKKDLGLAGLPLLASAVVGTLSWLLFPGNSPTGAKENIAKHYDISLKLYEQMLGPTMQYSGAYYHKPGMSLEEAQLAKMRLVAEKLDLKPGMKVLELGCGFGALADLISTEYGVHVTGVTLSEDQYAYAKENFKNPAVDIRLQDYRSMTGQFDRIYSVGIFEHIGRNCYQTYFDKCHELLKDNGIMVIHSIGFARRGEWNHAGWMNKYIFPGAELPTMSHFTQEFNDRWHMEDWQSFGVSYAKTLREWKHRLDNWRGLEEFELRFRRMWEYYLDCCAASFEARRTKLWQIVYTKMPAATQREDDCHHIRQPMISKRPQTASRWNTEIS